MGKTIVSQESTFVPFKRPGMAIPHGAGAPVQTDRPTAMNNVVNDPRHGSLPEGRVAARFQKALQANANSAQEGVGLHDFVETLTEASGPTRGTPDRSMKAEYRPGEKQGAPLVRTPPPVGASPQEVRNHYKSQASLPGSEPMYLTTEDPQNTGNQGFVPTAEIKDAIPEYVESTFASEEEGTSVDLPSRFAFYPFKDLYVYTLRGKHLRKLARAHKENSLLQTAEVVSSVLRTTDPAYQGRPLAFDLTIPDFYWVLYYLRQNSFTKSSFTHVTNCTNPAHIKLVEDGKASVKSLRIEEVITKSTLVNNMLENLSSLASEGIPIRPATIRDLVLIMEHPSFIKEDPEFTWTSEIASYVGGGLPIQTRIDIVDEMTPDQISAIKAYEEEVSNYGIDELVTVHCKECGASRRDRVSIDASTFLSVS